MCIYIYIIIYSYWTYIYLKIYIYIFRERDDICIWLLFNSAMCHRQNWRTESDSHSVLQTKQTFADFDVSPVLVSWKCMERYWPAFFFVSLGLLAWSTGECYDCRKVWEVNLTHVLILFQRKKQWLRHSSIFEKLCSSTFVEDDQGDKKIKQNDEAHPSLVELIV